MAFAEGGLPDLERRVVLLLESGDPGDLKHATPRELLRAWNRFAVELHQTPLIDRLMAQAAEIDRQNGVLP